MYRPTVPKPAMITTYAGMRRILKKPIRIIDYYRQAVETGVYRTPQEIDKMLHERKLRNDPLRDIMKRFRQDIVRGNHIQDYPEEYLILRQNPPVPALPKYTKKEMRMFERERQDRKDYVMKKLVEAYLKRQEEDQQRKGHNGLVDYFKRPTKAEMQAPITAEEYYQRLLGVSAPDAFHSNMGHKAAPLQKAYASAVKHYQLVRTEGLSDEEAMDEVDKILKQTAKNEQHRAMQTLLQAKKIRQKPNVEMPTEQDQEDVARIGDMGMEQLIAEHESTTKQSVQKIMKADRYYEKKIQKEHGKDVVLIDPTERNRQKHGEPKKKTNNNTEKEQPTGLESLFDNVLGSNPRVLEAMMRWSVRLGEVPYSEWTVGASTALDHWIARQVLAMSEETWQMLLEGNDPDLLALGRSVVQTREALFPETKLHAIEDEEIAEDMQEEPDISASSIINSSQQQEDHSDSAISSESRSLEELLESLGSMDESSTQSSLTSVASEGGHSEVNKMDLIKELQAYRAQNKELKYDLWQENDKLLFEDWFKSKFLPAMLPEQIDESDDWDEVKRNLLDTLPFDEEQSENFWSSLQSEKDAVELLDQMRKHGPPPGATVLQAAFWKLSYEEQLQQLLNFGAIRPLLDEYYDETDRLKFIQKYYDVLLTGVPMEVLVPDDEEGTITIKDMSKEAIKNFGLDPNDKKRYKLEIIPFRASTAEIQQQNESTGEILSSTTMERGHAMFKAWNEHKANRARYEEEMFRTYRLGLRYSDPPLEIGTSRDNHDDVGEDDKKL